MPSRTANRSNTKSRQPRAAGFVGQRIGSGVARYYQLYELLSNALNDGSIPAGGTLPSEPQLVARYRVSRTTVRRALARLSICRRVPLGTRIVKISSMRMTLSYAVGSSQAASASFSSSISFGSSGPNN